MFVIAVLGVVAYGSFQPTMHLKAAMPAGFVDESRTLSPQMRVHEEKIARAYWQCAVNSVQWNYSYGHRLPDQPPAEFLLTAREIGTAASDTGSRLRYWHNLQRVWNLPSSWERVYGFDLNSMNTSLQASGAKLEAFLRRITGASW